MNVYQSYHYSMSLDGREQPISEWSSRRFRVANRQLMIWKTQNPSEPVYNKTGHIGFGFALTGLLQWACMTMPRWPVHPIGLLVVSTFYGNRAWPSVFLGWLLKITLLRYGGAWFYRAARPAFLGLIIGEVFAAVFWGLVPSILLLMGKDYQAIPIQPY